MEWWGWIAMGLFLIVGELLTPGLFFLLFFGVGALLIGLIVGLDIGIAPWFQWVLFGVLAPILTVLFRQKFLQNFATFGDQTDRSGLIGESVVLNQALEVGVTGKGELRGAPWNVKNVGAIPLSENDSAKVVKVSGMTLEVEKL